MLFKLFLRRERPDWLILNGEFQDFWEISSHDLTPRGGKDFKREIETGKKILRSFRRSLPRARITWIEGNHEFRLRKYLIQNARELYGLPGVSVPDIFDLKRLKIEYVACHELATKFTDNFMRVGDLYVGHWDRVWPPVSAWPWRAAGWARTTIVRDTRSSRTTLWHCVGMAA